MNTFLVSINLLARLIFIKKPDENTELGTDATITMLLGSLHRLILTTTTT